MDSINEIAARHGLVVIEDAAQAQGSIYNGRRAGSLGHAAATSFYPGKNLGALGDGGAILTNDSEIAGRVRKLRNYGSTWKYNHEVQGYNTRLDELQAAFLREKLRFLDEWNNQRAEIAEIYTHALGGYDVDLPAVAANVTPVWHLYIIRTKSRENLMMHLNHEGISTAVHYPTPPHMQPCYRGCYSASLEVAELLSSEVLSLPLYPYMQADLALEVCKAIKRFRNS
jgi:dTDP-4-amino-4,6-dideoxygalactose transaminase